MPEVQEKRVELILQQLEELPTLPAVVLQVLEVTADDASSAAQVVHLIESDPALTARILQLVQRADRGISSTVQSVERAVVMLGFEAIRNAAVAASIFESFPPAESGREHNRGEIWKHCVAVACCAELLAEATAANGAPAGPIDPSAAFLCGLLHDLGKIALDAALPKSFARVVEAADLLRGNIADVERRVIGLDHMVVGKRLAERWKLPEAVRDCAWLHGQLPQALPAGVKHPKLINLITLSDQLTREQHLGYSGNYTSTVSQQIMLDALGLKREQIEAAMRLLVERIEPRAKALALGEADSSALYQEALAQANRELGRVSGQLQAKNRRLAVRSQFFDALSGFQSGLRADVSAQEVLHAIAQTAVAVLGVPAVAAFSLPPGRDFAEAVLCGPTGNVFETSLIDVPGSSASGAPVVAAREGGRPELLAGDGPVMPTGEDLEWLVSAISPRLPHAKRFWISLTADGACAGGVVWGAEPGEAHRLGPQAAELNALAHGWSLALRTAQVREEARDLSEQLADSNRQLQAAQAQILRSRTMISVGEMAAGAAHEMNNPLAVISGRSQLLASQLTEPKLKAAAHLIHEQSHRLSAIITELMAFARPEAPSPQESDVAELLDRAMHEAKMHNDPADRVIELTMGEIPSARVDPQQLTAALSEVMDNAIQATDPTLGHIAVHAAYDAVSSQIVVTITDDGCGMDEATLKRAFDPFFSSKPAGRRRGLGLAKALRWIEASGGSIRLESRPGHGARTTVLLPAAPRSDEPMMGERRKAENF